MEKLGVEKQQLLEELQADYNRKRMTEHEMQKTGAPAPARAQLSNELEQIKTRIDDLQKE